ncbi:two-component histidine kinase PhoR [Gordonia hirsuta DSM 44140 = NBRC 16056]|uniref:histidine kinase n=1 Tax=Gordonia hirsuta DSM 44140 = NBRC 16056 TaxID=1121927 RepID=L7LA29_9ACTN|nr:HAMP domain-containing sensor histidine kinase [Gordonia hirsuta]GAC56912.1 two-component histidine kinase PhoR [Gordonia hirsuta DSM 44140 = NBRC 16056]
MTLPRTAPRRGIPLRVSLVALTLALVVVGLAGSGLAVTSAMRADLIRRVDASLVEATSTWARPMREPVDADRDRDREPGPRRPPSSFYVNIDLGSEHLVVNDYAESPDLATLPAGNAGPLTVSSVDGGPQWRVIKRVATGDGAARPRSVVVATPLKDVDATVSRLVWLQTGIGFLVVAVLGVAGYLLVRSSLRPLRRVEETAHAIAGGDLAQRVPQMRPGTEVASLAHSVNAMLGQIQRAFASTAASEQQARASEERMRRFIADASHELRTPLTSIKGFAELIGAGMTPDPADGIARIAAEADRMGLLVEDLLMLARLDAQRPLAKAPVELPVLVHDAVAAARAAAGGREIVVVDETDGFGPVVEGDGAQLTQVLRNLLTNAVMYTPADTPITVVVGVDGDQARVEVIDEGPGLSEDEAQRVFERFYRGDSSRHRGSDDGGSGLGLSIVAALIAAHDGAVGVASRPGAGARFWFVLPRLDRPD